MTAAQAPRVKERYGSKRESGTVAVDRLRRGIKHDAIRIPHQAVVEFVAAVSRPVERGRPLLERRDARREAEEFLCR